MSLSQGVVGTATGFLLLRGPHQRRVRTLIETRLDDVRSDRTAHQLRLEQLIPSLVEEFGGKTSAEEIRACADAVLGEFVDVPVRRFVVDGLLKQGADVVVVER